MEPITAAGVRPFDESKVRRAPKGVREGGRFVAVAQGPGKYTVEDTSTGETVATTVTAAEAVAVAGENNLEADGYGRGLDDTQAYYDLAAEGEQLGIPVDVDDPASPETVPELAAQVEAAKTGQPVDHLKLAADADARVDTAQTQDEREFWQRKADEHWNNVPSSVDAEQGPADAPAPSPVEGPFKYPSGWEGRYDPAEGRYIGMDDIYMPADFDPARDAGSAMVQRDPSAGKAFKVVRPDGTPIAGFDSVFEAEQHRDANPGTSLSTPESRANAIPPDRARRVAGLANLGAEGGTRADGPSHMDYSPEDLRATLASPDAELTPAGRANIERTLALYDAPTAVAPRTIVEVAADDLAHETSLGGMEEVHSAAGTGLGDTLSRRAGFDAKRIEALANGSPDGITPFGLEQTYGGFMNRDVATAHLDRLAEQGRVVKGVGPNVGTSMDQHMTKYYPAEAGLDVNESADVPMTDETFGTLRNAGVQQERIDAMKETRDTRVPQSTPTPKTMFRNGATAAIRQAEQGSSLDKSNARAARAALQAIDEGRVVGTDDDFLSALDRINQAPGSPERSQLNSQLDVVKGLALGKLPTLEQKAGLTVGSGPGDYTEHTLSAARRGGSDMSHSYVANDASHVVHARVAPDGSVSTARIGLNPTPPGKRPPGEEASHYTINGKPAVHHHVQGVLGNHTDALYKLESQAKARTTVNQKSVRASGAHSDGDVVTYPHRGRIERGVVRDAVLTDRVLLSGITASAAGMAPDVPPAEWFEDPQFDKLTPLTVTPEGRVFGHVAPWNVCHTGVQGRCVTAPRSSTEYSYFNLASVMTDGGEVAAGKITMSTGHAPITASSKQAAEHYDNSGAVGADVRAGQDSFGPWFAGAVRPELDATQVRALERATVSGDWRRINGRGGHELVGLLAVNVPGFPIPRAQASVVASANGGEVMDALVAAGVICDCVTPDLELDEIVAGAVPAVTLAMVGRRAAR